MGYWQQVDLENALSPATVIAIFDDANNNTVSGAALSALIARCDNEVNSFIATNYPRITLPADPVPEPLKFASLELGIVYSRDRKPEYWKNAQDHERQNRLKEALDKLKRYATSEQFIYDSPDTANQITDFGSSVVSSPRRGW